MYIYKNNLYLKLVKNLIISYKINKYNIKKNNHRKLLAIVKKNIKIKIIKKLYIILIFKIL